MTLLDIVLAYLITYSDTEVIEYNDKLKAAYVNINRAVISLYLKNKKVCVGLDGSNIKDKCFETQSPNEIVEKLRDNFA